MAAFSSWDDDGVRRQPSQAAFGFQPRSGLQHAQSRFADMPQANRLTIGIMAVMAQHEREMISERTKAALAAAKRRGVKLGGFRSVRFTAKHVKLAVAARQEKARARAI